MGRYYGSGKEEADGLKKVDVAFLNKHGYFSNGWRSGNITWSRNGEKTGNISIQSSVGYDEQYIRFIYTQTDRSSGEKTDFDYKIPLTTTPCYFGGKRYWFTCPWYANHVYCGRRVGVLYLSGKYFACRHCNNLTYNSRNLSGFSKVAGKVISAPELDELRDQVKRKYYAGKITKRFMRYIKKERKFSFQLQTVVEGLNGKYKRNS
jgi:hypothetical protein